MNAGSLDGHTIDSLHTPRRAAWEQECVDRFVERMLDREHLFPCIFGVDAVRKDTLRAAFVPADAGIQVLATALREFTEVAEELGRRTSLVVFFESTDGDRHATVDDYRQRFWSILQQLHDGDDSPWPQEISAVTSDPTWEFCYAGMPMFVVANTPAHTMRASRQFDTLALTFQPRFVFDDISEDTPQGHNARKVIRQRLSTYDAVPTTPLLGSFGAAGNQEWTQYFLDDDNTSHADQATCPFNHRREDADRATK